MHEVQILRLLTVQGVRLVPSLLFVDVASASELLTIRFWFELLNMFLSGLIRRSGPGCGRLSALSARHGHLCFMKTVACRCSLVLRHLEHDVILFTRCYQFS